MVERSDTSWPVCAVDQATGCTGIELEPGGFCLAHVTGPELDSALKRISDTGVVDARGAEISEQLLNQILVAAPKGKNGFARLDARFKGATFSSDVRFYGVTFSAYTDFAHAVFNGNAEFHRVTFDGEVRFFDATFNGNARFEDATFSGYAGFIGASFIGEAWFNSASFNATASFQRATFDAAASFESATFNATAWFDRATFPNYALFSRATFNGDARFAGATFNDHAGFDLAIFNRDAGFGETTFSGFAGFTATTFNGDAGFDHAIFTGNAGFGRSVFNGNARFDGATFSRYAGFVGASINGDAGFHRASFNGDPSFREVTFRGNARFGETKFEQARRFGPMVVYQQLDLDGTEFTQPVQIEVSTTRLSCRRARFPSGVQFRLRWAAVVLDDTDLAAPSILTGIPQFSDNLTAQEANMVREWRQTERISERPQLMSLQRANVAGLGLTDVSATDCRFAGAHNLDKMRLESDISFARVPLPWNSSGRRWEVIAEERTWRVHRAAQRRLPNQIRALRRWTAPQWPEWLSDQSPGVLEPGQIAGLYRALRKGREDAKDEPDAADFYYGEMEMRRQNRRTSRSPSDSLANVASRGRAERAILTAYWLVSGYGLRAWRATAWLAAVTLLFAEAFHLVGFAVPPHPVSYWTSLLYAFRATVSLSDDQVTLTAWGQLLQAVLRLTGPVLLGLMLLALRGRVKR